MAANFSVAGFNGLMSEISLLIRMSGNNRDWAAKFDPNDIAGSVKSQAAMSDATDAVKFILEMLPALLRLMPSGHIESARDRLQHWQDRNEKDWGELFSRLCVLRDAIVIGCKEYMFYAYTKEKGKKLSSWREEWRSAVRAFPAIELDVFAATDCYALQHYTASVFHSMRIAEHGLRALAKERKLRLPKDKAVEWATWQEIIRALDNEIKAVGLKKASKARDKALEFYSGSRADLNGFKDEYRNAVMHVREHYDEHQAARALNKVHAFMERVAAKIDHTHKRINWNRS